MKRLAVVLVLIALLMNAVSLLAQDATPEATPEPSAEATIEPTPEATAEVLSEIGELFASLPQTRLADGGFVVGKADAPITLVEFIDYACPHCQEYRPVIDQVLMHYLAAGQMKYELRLLPTAGGQLSYIVDMLVECAEKQRPGAFWQSYDLLYGYAETGKYDQDVGKRMASAFDIDYDEMLNCADQLDPRQVDIDLTNAQAWGVTGTPAVLVRYGDGDPQFITLDDVIYNRGGVPLDVLTKTIDKANGIEVTPESTNQLLRNIEAVTAF